MNAGLLAIWVQTLGTIITIWAGALGIRWQVKRQWLAHSAALLVSLEEQFRNEEFMKGRVKLAHKIQTVEIQKAGINRELKGYWPVVSFFDNLGAMVRRKAIDEELVWCRFGWRITRCYISLKLRTDILEKTRTYYREPLMYEEFEWLAEKMLKQHYNSKGISLEPAKATEEYIEQESTLLDDENQPPHARSFELGAAPNSLVNPTPR